ncbi:MAG: glycoside hydrolase family 2 [Kiritimatiellae bacterium]|nr:glycoside hydrolase family 2 [Kiritimatiellia bacterium]
MKKVVAVCFGILSVSFSVSALSLDGSWSLSYWKQPDDGAIRTVPVTVPLETVPAQVPGVAELSLQLAGKAPDPMIGTNVYLFRPYEGYQWLYTKTFTPPVLAKGQRAELVFEGIDTLADIFLNGSKIGETDNMLIAHSFDVTKYLRAGTENILQVLIRSIVIESQYQTIGELGYSMAGGADGEPFRKAGSMYGWDIHPRLACAGIWRPVSLEIRNAERIDHPAWIVRDLDRKNRSAFLWVDCRVQSPFSRLDRGKVRVTLSRNGKVAVSAEQVFRHYLTRVGLSIQNADFWWPRGFGDSALYDGTIELLDESGKTLARDSRKIGIRTVELERDDCYSSERSGQFLFRVNGEPIFIRGTNWVPLDAFHSRDMEHMLPTLDLIRDANCNLIRVWGGGVYEPEIFFDYCDQNGILVWQDFCTGCSVFPQNDRYAEQTRQEVLSVVLRLRNHASLALWSGNNENDNAFHWQLGRLARDPNQDRNSRRTIPDVLYEFDVTRPYLPSSPYESPAYRAGQARMPEDHLWGPRGYYKTPFYTNSAAWFVSEIGYHGAPNRASLERMMTPSCVYPWTNSEKKWDCWNPEWQCKATMAFVEGPCGTRNNLMLNQVKLMFGSVSSDLDTFIAQSQLVQAEAMKTFVELFRSRKFTRSNGIVWWNMRDAWPIISDAVVDYYGGKKRAFYEIKNVQYNQLVMINDDHRVIAVNDTLHPVRGHAKVTDVESGKVLLDLDYEVAANATAEVGMAAFDGQGVCRIDYSADGETHVNHFLYGTPVFDYAKVAGWLEKAR